MVYMVQIPSVTSRPIDSLGELSLKFVLYKIPLREVEKPCTKYLFTNIKYKYKEDITWYDHLKI